MFLFLRPPQGEPGTRKLNRFQGQERKPAVAPSQGNPPLEVDRGKDDDHGIEEGYS
jgi:hypothetical protein